MYCSKSNENITYRELKFKSVTTDFIDREIPTIYYIAKTRRNIIINTGESIWKIDLKSKKSKKIIDNGIGPDQIFSPFRVVEYNNDIYINSYIIFKCFYKFSPDLEKLELKTIQFNNTLQFDDFAFVSKDLLAATYVYWEDGYVRLYDLKTWKSQKIRGKSLHPLMLNFNVNRASLCVLENNIYVAQTIKPKIQVISLKENKTSYFIKLSPPFYKPMPDKYDVEKYDNKNHKKWMASWTGIFDIFGKNCWLLIIYKWGYDNKYCYELINLKNLNERFFINETDKRIYEFDVDKTKIKFEFFTELEEMIIWQNAIVYLY